MAKVNSIGLVINSIDDDKQLLIDNSQSSGIRLGLKSNFTAIVAPSASDDSSAGYERGSRWYDTAANNEYVCVDASIGSATWKQTTGGGAGSGDVTGPASSTDNALVRFNGTGGKDIQDSLITLDDSGNFNSLNLKGISSGFTGSELKWRQIGLQTVSNTLTSILTISLSFGEMVTAEIFINGLAANGSNSLGYKGTITARNGGSGASIVGHSYVINDEVGIYNVTATTSSNNLLINVLGSNTTVNWVCSYQYFKTVSDA